MSVQEVIGPDGEPGFIIYGELLAENCPGSHWAVSAVLADVDLENPEDSETRTWWRVLTDVPAGGRVRSSVLLPDSPGHNFSRAHLYMHFGGFASTTSSTPTTAGLGPT